ncbi:hypothetical protein NMG60_11001543 [Bertholletia excelsa]
MRTGGCSVHQALTAEAASLVKQAITLAQRRGHAQVTPLHVANTMLAASGSLLRAACLQSHSHPLQCKALEVCFNVALNRLPAAAASAPLLPHHQQNHHYPTISNALVAAFKRAQAHQRRGSIENQQQPLLAVKIELDQLIISILDDPSVSRVMREAGFSSTEVKSSIEKAVSPPKESRNSLVIGAKVGRPRASDGVRNEDVMSVINNMMNKRNKGFVIVGECLATIEGVVGGLMDKVDSGEVPESFREVKFISLPLFSVGDLSRGEVEEKLVELGCLVRRCAEKGVVLYLGDLEWTTKEKREEEQGRKVGYCAVEHIIIEIGRLAFAINGESRRLWLMGIATFQTYMRCRNRYPSLETIWGVCPLTIPEGSLGLSLIPESDVEDTSRSKKAGNASSWLLLEGGRDNQVKCCGDDAPPSSLPSWLQQYKDESKKLSYNHDQDHVQVRHLCEKWNSSERTITFSSVSPSCSTFGFSHGIPKSCEPSLRIYIPKQIDPKQAILSNPSSTPNSASSSDTMEVEYVQRFKELNSENLKAICNALEKEVPRQKDVIPEIASTILKCRSGMVKRKVKVKDGEAKEETWLFFQGVDVQAKEKIARELARLVFGSNSSLVTISLSRCSSTKSNSTEEYLRNKRSRDCSYIERFAEAVSANPHRVFLVEDLEQVDYCSQIGIKRAIERGRIGTSNGEEVSLRDAIIIFSCENFNSRGSRSCSPSVKQKLESCDEKKVTELETSPSVSLDLNISIEDESSDQKQSTDDLGLLESVDGRMILKNQVL